MSRYQRHPSSERSRRPLVLPGLLALALAGAPGCRRSAPPPEDPAPVPVELTRIVPQTIDDVSVLTGVLQAYRAVDVVTEVSGKIVSLHRDVGSAVTRGVPLASLDKTVLRESFRRAEAAWLAAEARSGLARDEFRRDSTLFAQGDIAPAAFDGSRTAHASATAEAKAAHAAMQLAAHDLAEGDVRAPFSGVVTRRHAEIGSYVIPGAPLFRIANVDSLRLVLSVSQHHVGRLEVGGEAAVAVETLAERRFTGRIRSISAEADASTRTFPVEIVLANPPDRPLRDGFVVRAALVLGRFEEAITVPREAVLKRLGENFVFVVADSVASQRPVRLGPLIGDRYVIVDGLDPGDAVVTVGMQNLGAGARVISEPPPVPLGSEVGEAS